jgi:nitroreductase
LQKSTLQAQVAFFVSSLAPSRGLCNIVRIAGYLKGFAMLIDLLRTRRSIRRFKDQQVEREKLDLLLEAALRAPTSRGNTPWDFIVVTDRQRLGRLAAAKLHGSSFLKDAPLAIVVCADPARSDVWVEDAAIAATFIQLQAADLGLGSCWVQIRLRRHDENTSSQAYLAELLDLPENMMVLAVVGIGYPMERKDGHPLASLSYDRISYERFGLKG